MGLSKLENGVEEAKLEASVHSGGLLPSSGKLG